jgi:cobalt/nickel transport system permease protein
MLHIDQYAYLSRLRGEDPSLKVLFTSATMGICLWADSVIISLLVIIIMASATVFVGGISGRFYGKLLLIPLSFLVVGVLTIAVDVSRQPAGFLCAINFAERFVGITVPGILRAVRLFCQAFGCISCLYFLSLTTPLVDLLAVLRKLRVPKLIVELMGLVYRFIFILLDMADAIYTAQASRLGYATVRSGYRSLSALASMLFIRSYKQAQDLYAALESRGYDGELRVVEPNYTAALEKCAVVVFCECLLIACAVIVHRCGGSGW